MMTTEEKRAELMNAWGVPEFVIDERVGSETASGVLDEDDVLERILIDASGGFASSFEELEF